MMSDYGYLEDMSRQTDTLSRLNMKNDPKKAISKKAAMKQKELVKQAKRVGIMLSLLPAGLKRRKINYTNFMPKQQMIFWTVEFVFVSCDNKHVLLHRIPSSKPMREILDDLLISDTPHSSDALTRFQLQSYIDAGSDSFTIGLKKEFVQAAQQNTYINVTPMMDAPLADILKGESLCEFPTFHVWLHNVEPVVTLEDKAEEPTYRGLAGDIKDPQATVQRQQELVPEAMVEAEDGTKSSSQESESEGSESSDSEDDSNESEEESEEDGDEEGDSTSVSNPEVQIEPPAEEQPAMSTSL